MISDYLEHLREQGYSPKTVAISERWLRHFVSHHPGPVEKLTSSHLTGYHQSLQWEPGPSGKLYSENTVNQAVGVLKAFFRWLVKQGYLEQSPAEHLITRRVPTGERVALSSAEVRSVLALPDVETPLGLRDRAILGLALEEQARPPALHRLDLGDFQPDTGAVLLRGRKRRIVSLGEGLCADLERYIRLGREGYARPGETALFLNHRGSRLSTQGLRLLIKSYEQTAFSS